MLFEGYLLAFGGATLACLVGAYQAREISDPDTRYGLVALLLTSAGWAGGHVGFLLVPTLRAKVAFYLFGLVVGFATVGAWLWFCSAYTGRILHRNRKIQVLALLLFAGVTLMKLANPYHGLYFTMEAATVPFPYLAVDHHLLYWLNMGLAYALAAMGYFMLLELSMQVHAGDRALAVLAGLTALPALFNVAAEASPLLLNLPYEPIGVAAFAAGVLYVYRGQFQSVRLAGAEEGPVLALTSDGQIRGYNSSAADLFPTLDSNGAFGRPLDAVLPEVAHTLDAEDPILELGPADQPRYYQLTERVPDTDQVRIDRLVSLTDVTEREAQKRALERETAALRTMYRITADQEISFEEKVQWLLDLGRTYLDLSYGCLTRIAEDEQHIAWVSGDPPQLEPGTVLPLSQAICPKTVEESGTTSVQRPPTEGREDETPSQQVGFNTYIGTRIVVEDEFYGTFCFGGPEPRAKPFEERERVFMELLAQWTGYELEGRQAQKRLERKNERLDRFASVLSHDLRNPLNVATGRLELADAETESSHEAHEHLSAAHRALTRMSEIMEDVLTLTWGSEHLDPDDLTTCPLATAARESWDQVETAEAQLRVDGAPRLRAEERRLGRLLENLFRNAVEHGGEAVTVTVGALPDGFFVADDGPGLPEDRADKLFEAGYSSRKEGTGLGLSIVKSIADAHGWTVSLGESPTGGARFEFRGVEGTD